MPTPGAGTSTRRVTMVRRQVRRMSCWIFSWASRVCWINKMILIGVFRSTSWEPLLASTRYLIVSVTSWTTRDLFRHGLTIGVNWGRRLARIRRSTDNHSQAWPWYPNHQASNPRVSDDVKTSLARSALKKVPTVSIIWVTSTSSWRNRQSFSPFCSALSKGSLSSRWLWPRATWTHSYPRETRPRREMGRARLINILKVILKRQRNTYRVFWTQ